VGVRVGGYPLYFKSEEKKKKKKKRERVRERGGDSPSSVMQNQDEVEFGLLST
jgi:hypothetical protein